MAEKKDRPVSQVKCRMASLLFFLGCIYDWFLNLIFGWIHKERSSVKLPPTSEKFLTLSAGSLAEKIRRKELSSEIVVKAFIKRIAEVNGPLNAVVDSRFDEAIKEAKEVDIFLSQTNLSEKELAENKPYLGVPFSTKESIACKGLSFTLGLVARKGTKATTDAVVVQRLKEAGGILIGVTNIPELNLWIETRNKVFNQTSNPYCLSRSVGGSSGGEGCINAACGTAMGIGSDIGGSIRIPAYFCGIFGHKPTTGLVPITGIGFNTVERESMVCGGTMTRYAEDIAPFLKVLLGENAVKLHLDEKVNFEDLKFYYVTEPRNLTMSSVSPELKGVIHKAVDHLTNISKTEAEKVSFRGFSHCLALWRHSMSKEGIPFDLALGNFEERVSLMKEVPKTIMRTSDHTLAAILGLIDRKILPITDPDWAEEEISKLRKELLRLLGDNGVLIFPSFPTVAPYHYQSFFRPHNFAYFALFNVLKFPVTQVPMGLSSEGLPLGLQVVAGPYNDRLCIAVAKELEKTFGGWVPPFTT